MNHCIAVFILKNWSANMAALNDHDYFWPDAWYEAVASLCRYLSYQNIKINIDRQVQGKPAQLFDFDAANRIAQNEKIAQRSYTPYTAIMV